MLILETLTTFSRPAKPGTKRHPMAGQALVETVIWGGLFITVLLTVPMIIKVADIRSKHHEATRYAVWERTVWSPSAKSNAELLQDIDLRVMGHMSQALTETEKKENPFWSHGGNKIIEGNEEGTQSTGFSINQGASPAERTLVAQFAYGGGVRGDLNLNGSGFSTMTVQTNLLDRFDENEDHRYQLSNATETFAISTGGAILTDAWSLSPATPPSTEAQENGLANGLENLYQSRVDGLVLNEEVEIATFLGDLAAKLFLPGSNRLFIGEGNRSGTVTLPVYSEVVEDTYVRAPEN